MNKFMLLHIFLEAEASLAIAALMGLKMVVKFHVALQGAGLTESFVAQRTNLGPLSRVNSQMLVQRGCKCYNSEE